jgi:hypothetical protein
MDETRPVSGVKITEGTSPYRPRHRSLREKKGALTVCTSRLGEALVNVASILAVETGRR